MAIKRSDASDEVKLIAVTEEACGRSYTVARSEEINWDALKEAIDSDLSGLSAAECCCCSMDVGECELRVALSSKVLSVARDEGWKILKGKAFPLLSKRGRQVWTTVQLLQSSHSQYTHSLRERNKGLISLISCSLFVVSCSP